MPKFYLNDNAQNTGEHEIHEEGCPWLKFVTSKTDLGYCYDCHEALRKAKNLYPSRDIDGCKHCCLKCHTK